MSKRENSTEWSRSAEDDWMNIPAAEAAAAALRLYVSDFYTVESFLFS